MSDIKKKINYTVVCVNEFANRFNIASKEAFIYLYDSDIYEKLMDAETGLYRESPSYVYGLLQDEINFGHIVQAEGTT